MPGCSSAKFAAAAATVSMTGPTNLGPIQPQQQLDSSPLVLDPGLFSEPNTTGRYSQRPELRPTRRKMNGATSTGQPVQLTPLWEYVVRTRKFPKDVDPITIFEEISERLRDPEWEVRQHALRVLVDVLPTFDSERIDNVANIVLPDLIDNLGNPAPAVRKGSLDTLRIYLLNTANRDDVTRKILHDGMNRADVFDNYQTSIATGVILSTPLLLFPSRSSTRPSNEIIRDACQALAMRIVQVTHQESALRSLAKIRETIGEEEFNSYLREMDDSMKRNFDLLCEVYGIRRGSSGRKRPRSKTKLAEKIHRRDSVEESITDVVAVDNSWETDDSDTSGIAEDDEGVPRLGSSSSVTSARVVLETEIKFNEETAITMTILEEQEKALEKDKENNGDDEDEEEEIANANLTEGVTPQDRRKTPRRVHFGGEIVKLRTPDSENDSVISEQQQKQSPTSIPRTRIPLPVAPATRLPPERPPRRRVRSSSQPLINTRGNQQHRPRRSASTSPRREVYVHDANLSPKKSILTKNSEFGDKQIVSPDKTSEVRKATSRPSRRDSMSPALSPRVIMPEIRSTPEPSFRVCEEPINRSPRIEKITLLKNARSPSPNLLGDVCKVEMDEIDKVFGDKSGIDFQEKTLKDQENIMRTVYRSKSALEKTTRSSTSPLGDGEETSPGRERRRSQSAKVPGFEVFPRKERNYILMELSSPTKESSRRSSLQESPSIEDPKNESVKGDSNNESKSNNKDTCISENNTNESQVDSNKTVNSETNDDNNVDMEIENDDEIHLGILEEDLEKSVLDAKERSSDSSSDGEWKNKEPSWEELGLVDEEVLIDFHNKEDWRARVRGLERIASALGKPSALATVEPRLGSLLHAVLGGERSCRVAAAGFSVAKVALTGVSEEALKNRMSLIAWGLARQGGPNAANLARLAMLRASPGLFLEKLLQPQCIGARNSKMRENTLQLLIFSLVTFPSTEFKVKTAIDKVVAMVGDRSKRVRHSALDTLAVLAQIYESEDILETSKNFTKGKQDGQTIHAAITARLSRKLLPMVTVDGLVVYGLQISPNSPHNGADVEWIVAGSGSVSPGTGRTRGQLIAMSKIENSASEQNTVKKSKSRPASEHSITNSSVSDLLEKNERTSSWKLLPSSDQNDRQNQDIKSRKIIRASKSADFIKGNNTEFEYRNNDETLEKESRIYKPYATPKRAERKFENQIDQETKAQKSKSEELSNQARVNNIVLEQEKRSPPKQESRIPIYTGDRGLSTKVGSSEQIDDNRDKSPADIMARRDSRRLDYGDNDGYISTQQKRRSYVPKSAIPRTNYTLNYANYSNNFRHPQYEDMDSDLQTKLKENYKYLPIQSFKENHRTLSYEKLNKGFDTVIKNSRAGLRSVPHYHYSSKVTETYESIYQRQRRLRDDKNTRMYETSPSPVIYGYDYDNNYRTSKKSEIQNDNNTRESQVNNRNSQKRRMFISPFDDYLPQKPVGISDKEAVEQETDDSNPERVDSGRTHSGSTNISDLASSSPRHDVEDARRNSGSSSSSNRSLTVSAHSRLRSRQTLPAHTESDESNGSIRNSQTSSPLRSRNDDKAFDVISAKSRRNTPDVISLRTEIEELNNTSSSDEHNFSKSAKTQHQRSSTDTSSVDSINNNQSKSRNNSIKSMAMERAQSVESLLSERDTDDYRNKNENLTIDCNGYKDDDGSYNGSNKSRPCSRCSSEKEYSARGSSPSKSMTNLNNVNDDADDREPSESPEEEDARFETLDFRNANKETSASRASCNYDNDLRNTDSNVTLYSCNSGANSPKNSSPRRFVTEEQESKDSEESDGVPAYEIGFGEVVADHDVAESSETGSDDIDDVGVKPQSRVPTPVDLPRRIFKVSPCKLKPEPNCNRSHSIGHRYFEKHVEKASKATQQCFTHLDSKDWDITLKGLRTLTQIAREEPEQLDACAPGLLARVLGKHVKNLRSQVARVACAAAGEVFSAHVRGIDQDLDEIAGPLLHRTADTNRFLREDCNLALDSMIEHFPSHRTIMTIANRGANHQNTIVHATTARLLHDIVNEIGPENAMVLPREVREKLFAATAKLLTDGNLQARKHAKETFRLLSRCEGFRKALTDAVPETTLRLIDKTLRTL